MIKNYLTSLLLALPFLTIGQSLTSSLAPPVNSMFLYYDANVPSPPFTFSKSGTGNTWDFSTLFASPVDDDTAFFVSPSSLALGGSFPNATHATYEGGDNSVTMIRVDALQLLFEGLIADPAGTGSLSPLTANPPAIAMNFPYSYGSTINSSTQMDLFTTGSAVGQPLYDSIHMQQAITIDNNVLASGSLVIPSGSFPSLLERRINTAVVSVWAKGALTLNQWVAVPGFPTTTVDSAFYWYSDQSLQHYAHVLYDSSAISDVHYFKSLIIAGVDQPSSNKKLSIYPNPAHDFLKVGGFTLPEISEWNIFDVTGKTVKSGNQNISGLNIQDLPSGTYFLTLTSRKGEKFEMRFIKN